MSIFGILNIGKQGLLSHQKALNTTANNIANVDTPGYTRQRAVFVPTAPAIAPDGTPLGGGVRVDRIERVVDANLDMQLLRERQVLGLDQRMAAGFDRLEGIFEELSDTGISSSLRDFFDSLQDLSSDAGDTQRQMVVQTGLTLTEQIRNADRRMDQLQTDANLSIEQVVGEINELAQQIASFNIKIFDAEGGGQPASALRDSRSAALTELAEKIDFTNFERADGQVAVFVGGGFLLIDQGAAGQLDLRPRGSGPDPEFFEIDQNFGGAIAGPITSLISGGDLGGLIRLRDTTVSGLRADLDEFAETFAREFNLRHIAGFGSVDGTNRNFFNPIAAVPGAASQISVNAAIVGQPGHVAAAGALDGVTGARGDTVNAQNMAALQTTPIVFPGPISRTAGTFYDGIVGRLGSDIAQAARKAEGQGIVVREVEARRAAISGVNLDEEVINLIKFQRVYQASAQVISTVNRLLEDLLSL